MPDDFLTSSAPPRRSGSLRGMLITALVAVLLSAGLAGWLASTGSLRLDFGQQDPDPAISPTVPAPQPELPLASAPAASPSASPAPLQQPALAGAFDQRVAALEDRLNQLSLRAEAASGNASRAEGMLIAFAVRRAIERGSGLENLADHLRLRFELAEPQAVRTVLETAPQGVTLDRLAADLDRLEPRLAGRPATGGGWDRLRREIGALFEIKRGDAEAGDPADQVDRARMLLRSGQVAKAREVVSALPGKDAAGDWLAAASRYVSVQAALDRLELAALNEPRELKDAAGRKVEQAGPTGF
jgi:hypothetical protein